MNETVDQLYSEIKGNQTASSNKNDDVNSLYNEIKGNPAKIAQPKSIPVTSGPDYGPLGMTKTDEENKASIKRGQDGDKSLLSKTADYVSELPGKYKKALNEDFTSSRNLASSGVENITRGNVASGLGQAVMGGIGMVTAPILGAPLDVAGNEATNITGNPKFGEKVKLLPTTGIPIGTAAKVTSALAPTNRAVKDLISTIGVNRLPEVIQRMKENPKLSLMDIVQPVREMGQKLVVTEGPHQGILEKATKTRIAEARGETEKAINEGMGHSVNVYDKLESMKQAARDVGKKVIEPALAGAKPIDVSSVIKDIDNTAKPGVNSVISAGEQLPSSDIVNRLKEIRQYLTDDKSVRTDPHQLHDFQASLRAEAEDLLTSSTGSDRRIGRAVMNIRNQIVDAIDAASGPQDSVTKLGPYKTGLSGYRDEKQIHEAFDKGTEILRNRSTKYDDLPEFWANWIKNAQPAEVSAAREGARTAYRQQVSSIKNAATKAEAIPEIEFNKEKLKMLFGEKEIDKMGNKLRDLREMAVTDQKLYHDSQTAMRTKANSKVDLPERKSFGQGLALPVGAEIASSFAGAPGVGTAAYWGGAAAKYGFDIAKLKLAMAKNTELSKLLTARGSERDQLIQVLSNAIPGPKPSLLSKGTGFLQSVVAP